MTSRIVQEDSVKKKKIETGMTARILQEDPNT